MRPDLFTLLTNCLILNDNFRLDCLELWNEYRSSINTPEVEYSVLSALEYPDKILITSAVTNHAGSINRFPIYCRYFDSKKAEIQETAVFSFFSKTGVISCPPNEKARFVAVSKDEDEKVETLLELIDRTESDSATHEIGACFGLAHESSLPLMESFMDDHIDIGVDFFYVSITKDIAESQTFQTLIERYQRQGLAEVQIVETIGNHSLEVLQLHDCYFRSRNHSKWVMNLSLNDRLKMRMKMKKAVGGQQTNLTSYLKPIKDNIGELIWKYAESKQKVKTIFRPDKIEEPDLFVNITWQRKRGVEKINVPIDVGYFMNLNQNLDSGF